jgi:signal peptidase I
MQRRLGQTLFSHATLPRLLLVLVLVLMIRRFVWTPVLITGKSMLPTLRGGQIAGINKLAYLRHPPLRGDIVAVWDGKQLLIKRIVGLPGEELAAEDGVFYMNGRTLPEPYVQFHDRWKIAPGKLEADHFVVAGDNRCETMVAVVTGDRIVGRLMH